MTIVSSQCGPSCLSSEKQKQKTFPPIPALEVKFKCCAPPLGRIITIFLKRERKKNFWYLENPCQLFCCNPWSEVQVWGCHQRPGACVQPEAPYEIIPQEKKLATDEIIGYVVDNSHSRSLCLIFFKEFFL